MDLPVPRLSGSISPAGAVTPRGLTLRWHDESGLDRATLESLLRLFGDLLPDPLSERVDVAVYAEKLLSRAEVATVEEDGRVVALGAIYTNDLESRRAFVTIFAVLPERHRRGIGRALASRLLARARQRGMRSCELLVMPGNVGALDFYRRSGFRAAGGVGAKVRLVCELPLLEVAVAQTPLEEPARLVAALDLALDVRVKRDDLYPATGGGSKARKIRYLFRETVAGGHDVMVTNGGPQSNHARAAALLAAELGIDCHLVLVGEPGSAREDVGNLQLMRSSGASIEWCNKAELAGRMDDAMARLLARGRKPHYVWGGGHGLAGTTAFVDAAAEARGQCGSWTPQFLVVASGTGSTQAGLAIGYADVGTRVIGISVARDAVRGAHAVRECADLFAAHRGSGSGIDGVHVEFREEWTDGGYERTSPELLELVRTAARAGFVVDPTYSGKALRGLVELARRGEIAAGSRVLFWHTGGLMNLQGHSLAAGQPVG